MIPRPDSPAQTGRGARDPLTDPLAWAGKIGQHVRFTVDGWIVRGMVVHARSSYGRCHVDLQQAEQQIRPRWIDASRVLPEDRP